MYTAMYTVEEDFLLRLLKSLDIISEYGTPGAGYVPHSGANNSEALTRSMIYQNPVHCQRSILVYYLVYCYFKALQAP